MKHTINLLILCFLAAAASAQHKADIEVSYTEHHPNMRNGKDDLTSRYILLANADQSKFFSPMTQYIDSLNSTPEGKARYQEITRTAFLGGKMNDIPRPDGSYYIVKSLPDDLLTCYDNTKIEKFYYEEKMPRWHWEITDSTKTILGYECIKAHTTFHGRMWTAWFTPEIPLNAGPWKLDGLPGLILEASAEGGQYSFVADGIQESDKAIIPVYLANEYEKTDRQSFLRAKRSFMDNPIGKLNAKYSGQGVSISKVTNKDGSDVGKLFVDRTVADFIETDY